MRRHRITRRQVEHVIDHAGLIFLQPAPPNSASKTPGWSTSETTRPAWPSTSWPSKSRPARLKRLWWWSTPCPCATSTGRS